MYTCYIHIDIFADTTIKRKMFSSEEYDFLYLCIVLIM